jgi:hypothetical protein
MNKKSVSIIKTHQKNYGLSQLTKLFTYLQYTRTVCLWLVSGIMLYQVFVVKVSTYSDLTYLRLLQSVPFNMVTT